MVWSGWGGFGEVWRGMGDKMDRDGHCGGFAIVIVHLCMQKCEIITPRVPVKNHTTACRRIAAVPIN